MVTSGMQGAPVSQTARDPNALIEAYRSYARSIAADIARRCGRWIEREELENAADLGLVEAATGFDPTRGVQFTTFSYYRIRGAVFDYLRKLGTRLPTFEVASNEYLKDVAGGTPSGSVEQECDDIRNIAGSLATCHLLSLEALNVQIADQSEESAEEKLLKSERRDGLRKAITQLPPRQQQILEAYYYKDISMDEIGRGLGLSRSRISRIHAKCLESLRAIMQGNTEPARRPAQDADTAEGEGAAATPRRTQATFRESLR